MVTKLENILAYFAKLLVQIHFKEHKIKLKFCQPSIISSVLFLQSVLPARKHQWNPLQQSACSAAVL